MKIGKAFLCFITLCIACPAAFAQELNVLPDPFEGGSPKEMTTRYLRNLARQAVEKRRLTFEGLKDAKDILAYQERMRQQFVEKLGGFPDQDAAQCQDRRHDQGGWLPRRERSLREPAQALRRREFLHPRPQRPPIPA